MGYCRETHEYLFHTQGRILRSRALQRVPSGERWNAEALQEVRVSPYALYRRPDAETIFMKDPSMEIEAKRERRA